MDRCPVCNTKGATITPIPGSIGESDAVHETFSVSCKRCPVPFEVSRDVLDFFSDLVDTNPRGATGLRRRWLRQLLEGARSGGLPAHISVELLTS
jgi:hypothetical protein